VLVRIFGSAPGKLQWENFQVFYPHQKVMHSYRFLKGERLPWEEFLVLLLLKPARKVAPAASGLETPFSTLLRSVMGKGSPEARWPRYHQGSPSTPKQEMLLPLLPLLACADAPRPGQLGFQDTATEAFFGVVNLHHYIWVWLVAVLVVVFAVLGLTVAFFWKEQLRYSLLTAEERRAVTEDQKLEFN
jgi:hypothetical protein